MTAPSTHILKQSHVRLAGIVANELLCLRVARRCGINAADSFVVELGNIAAGQPSDRDVLFASERYDRRFGIDPAVLDGHPVPYRLHQEDFSQALGISHSMKYERDGGMYLRQMFELLRSQSTSPYQDRLALWDLTVFNCLIGNTDAHLKNVSLMYSAGWDELRLAPAYDIVSTVFYPQCTDELAFAIGGVRHLGELDRAAFERAADQVSMGRVAAMRRLDDMVERFSEALDDEARRLADEGFPVALTIRDAILERGCVKALRSALLFTGRPAGGSRQGRPTRAGDASPRPDNPPAAGTRFGPFGRERAANAAAYLPLAPRGPFRVFRDY